MYLTFLNVQLNILQSLSSAKSLRNTATLKDIVIYIVISIFQKSHL
jgi:hypothetical protein